MIDWENGINKKRIMTKSSGYELLQGNGIVKGRLIGGSAAPLTYMIKGTSLFPKKEEWKETIIFLDSTNPYAPVQSFVHMLRGLASARIFDDANGLIISRPVNDDISDQLKQAVLQVIRDEEGLTKIPILLNVDCGHTAPINVLPYGAMAQINCEEKSFCILEPGVVD